MGAVKLQVVSSQGTELSSVVAGAPFLVEVVVMGNAHVIGKPTITGLTQDQIVSERSSTQMFITNGQQRSEQHLGYLVQFAKPGSYTLGPARIETDQGTLTSDTLTITVRDAPKESTKQHQAAFARWKIAKEKLVIGETVPYSLRLYYTDPKTAQVGLQGTDQYEHLIFTQEQPRQTTEKIGSVTYSVIELPGRVTPTQAGELTLPRALFTYTQPDGDDQQQEPWGSQSATIRSATVMSMFGGFVERKQAMANPLSFTVEPIPQAQHPVHGVGKIDKVTLTVDATKAKQGDPITCTLTIKGTFEPTLIKTPELTVPEALRVYPSSTKDTGAYPTLTKTCEYILQSTQAGKITIPSQKFFFFNPQTHKFQTFTTKAISLTITPNPQAQLEQARLEQERPEPPAQQANDKNTGEVENSSTPILSQSPEKIPIQEITIAWEAWWVPPLWLFLCLLIVPVIWRLRRDYFTRCYQRYKTYRKQKVCIKQSRRALAKALTEKNPLLLWQTLHTVARTLLPAAQSWTDQAVLDYLAAHGWQSTELTMWQSLWERSSQATFFATNERDLAELTTISTTLITRLEQTLVEKRWHHFFS